MMDPGAPIHLEEVDEPGDPQGQGRQQQHQHQLDHGCDKETLPLVHPLARQPKGKAEGNDSGEQQINKVQQVDQHQPAKVPAVQLPGPLLEDPVHTKTSLMDMLPV